MNSDFVEMLSALSAARVEFLVGIWVYPRWQPVISYIDAKTACFCDSGP